MTTLAELGTAPEEGTIPVPMGLFILRGISPLKVSPQLL